MERSKLTSTTTLTFTFCGLAFGALFPAFAYFIEANIKHRPLWDVFLSHDNDLLLLIDLAPFILGIFAYAIGKREAKLEAIGEDRSRQRFEEAEVIGKFGSWEMVLDTSEVRWSRGLYALYGVNPELPPSYEAFLARVHPDDREQAIAETKVIMQELPQEFGDEKRFITAQGELRHYRSTGAIVIDPKTKMRKAVGVTHDVTEIAEARLQAIEAAAAKAEFETINAMIVTYKHELNNPLAIALAALQTVSPATAKDPKIAVAEKALWRTAEILRLMDELVEKTTIEYGTYAQSKSKMIKIK